MIIALASRQLGMVGPIRTGFMFRVIHLTTMIVTLVCVLTILTPMEQGYFFTFVGLLAAQQVLELGLSLVVMQIASHAIVEPRWHGRTLELRESAQSEQLGKLLAWSLRWYGGVAVAFLCTVVPVGWFVLSGDAAIAGEGFWKWPWLLVGTVFAANFGQVPVLAVLEGSGRASQVFVFRSCQETAASVGLWVGLFAGLGLYSLGIYFGLRAVSGAIYVGRYRSFLASILERGALSGSDFSWYRQIWPLQWRIAVSWCAGYLIFQLTTPIVFGLLGPVAAGQWALTYLVVYNIGQFWLTWVAAQAPQLGNLAAQRKYREMEAMFSSGATRSIALCAMGLATGYAVLHVAFGFQLPYVDRFLEPSAAAILAAWGLINHSVNAMAVYLRAHREEPYLLPSLAGGILIPPAVYYCGSNFGVIGIASSYLVVGCLVGAGWGGMIFWRKVLACRATYLSRVAS